MGSCCGKLYSKNELESLKKRLKHIEYEDVKTYIPNIKFGKVVKVYDGDTITVASFVDRKPYRFSVRLNRIDCPELRTNNQEERCMAELSREFVKSIILGKIVKLSDIKIEKYGRLLAEVKTISGTNISDLLLAENLAVPYNGGKKFPFDRNRFTANEPENRIINH